MDLYVLGREGSILSWVGTFVREYQGVANDWLEVTVVLPSFVDVHWDVEVAHHTKPKLR
jgi:hypothetical protein